MSDDLSDILGGAPAATPGAAPVYDPTEAALRTIYAEASPKAGPNELRAIASVIRNRADAKGIDVGKVVQGGGFEAWNRQDGRERITSAPPEELDTLHDLVGDILAGNEAPTTDATHYYAPVAQAALAPKDGRPAKPLWDDGSGTQIGDHMFVKVGPSADLSDVLGGEAQAAEGGGMTDEPMFNVRGVQTPAKLTAAQKKTHDTLFHGGALDEKAELGSLANPFFVGPEDRPALGPPGSYYVDAAGKLARVPGAKASSFAAGLGQGVADVATSLGEALPGAGDFDLLQRLKAMQMGYGATYGGDQKSGLGRFTGQLLTSAPLLATGEGVLAPALRAAGPAGAFIAGNGARLAAGGLGRFALGAGSLATRGALEGAGAAGLASSASDRPLGEQVLEGGLGGALLGPVMPAVGAVGRWTGSTAKSLLRPLTASGQEAIVSDLLHEVSGGHGPLDLTEYVPGSLPTRAEAEGNAGVSGLERVVRTNPDSAQRFTARLKDNEEARAQFLDRLRGNDDTVTDLKDTREAATKTAREAALGSQSAPADIAPVVAKIDAILASPEGKRSEVVKALKAVKANLYDASGSPETDASMLYGVRKDLNDLLDPRASSDRKGAQLASSQLQDVRAELDKAIEAVAPGFKDYLKTYAEHSKPIDEQNFLQSQKLLDSYGVVQLSRVQSTLDRIDAWRRKPGANPAKSVSDETYKALTNLRDDLKRAANIDLGRARGSDTRQNLATDGIASQMGVPLALIGGAISHHPLVAPAVVGGKMIYGVKNKQIAARLATRLLEPEPIPPVPPTKPPSPLLGPLKRVGGAVLPAGGGLLLNNITSPR